jgi:hypothetical protein
MEVSVEHVAWQLAHEATVGEVVAEMTAAGQPPSFVALEREALTRLARRAARAGLGAAHAAWIARLDLSHLAARA